MATGFNRDEVAALLVKCHRRCCVCHRYCGTKIETDHIVPAAESHDHSIENAIPVCFDCHAEIHAYNPKHPRGRKFTAEELRLHRKQWLEICEMKPEIFLEANRNVDIGPLQGLLDELDYNLVISDNLTGATQTGFLFREEQLTRVIKEGVLSTLDDGLRQYVSLAYGAISKANEMVRSKSYRGDVDTLNKAFRSVKEAIPQIKDARNKLLDFVKSEDPTANQ
jgi:HNH endonuclease